MVILSSFESEVVEVRGAAELGLRKLSRIFMNGKPGILLLDQIG